MKYLSIIIFVITATAVSSVSFAAEIDEKIAAIINLNGHLCAKVTDVRPLEIKINMK